MKRAEFNNDKETNYSCLFTNIRKKPMPNLFSILFLSFTDDQLIMMVIDFFFPALTGTAIQVTHLLNALCHQPEVQAKIHNEIDQVVGQGQLPGLDDRIK